MGSGIHAVELDLLLLLLFVVVFAVLARKLQTPYPIEVLRRVEHELDLSEERLSLM